MSSSCPRHNTKSVIKSNAIQVLKLRDIILYNIFSAQETRVTVCVSLAMLLSYIHLMIVAFPLSLQQEG